MVFSVKLIGAGIAVVALATFGAGALLTPEPQVSRSITLTGANPKIDDGAYRLSLRTNTDFVCKGIEKLSTLFHEDRATRASTCDGLQALSDDADPVIRARHAAVVEACKSQGTIVCDDQIIGTGSLVNTSNSCRLVFPQHLLYDQQSRQDGKITLTPKPVRQCWFVNDSSQLGSRYSTEMRLSMTPAELACEPVRGALGQKSFDIHLGNTVRSGLSYSGNDARRHNDHIVVEVEDTNCVGLKPLTREDFQITRENRCKCATISTGSFSGVEFIDYYDRESSCAATQGFYEPGVGSVGVDHGFTTFPGTSGFMHRTFCVRNDGSYIMVPTVMGTAQRDDDGTVRSANGYSSRDEHILFNETPNIGILVEGIVFD